MSEQQTPDERFVAERLTAAAGVRELSPTPEAVVRKGRLMRRRQRVAQGGLALGVVAGLALGATQVDFAHADRKDVVVAVPAEVAWPTGSVYADRDAVCTYNEKTLAQRTLAFDGTIRTIESSTGGAAELDVHRWYAGGSGPIFNVDFPEFHDPGRKLEPGMRVLVSGMKDSGPDTPPVVWTCGFTRYWSQADAAVWDRAFGRLESPAAHSGAWCVSHTEVHPYGGRWSDGADAVEAARQASEVLDKRYGSNTGTNRRHLRAGVLGVAGDEITRQMVVVVDPSRVSIADLQTQLDRGRDETKHPAPVVVRAGCRSAEDLERFGALLDRRDWHPYARSVDMEYYLGPSESSWIVDIERGPAADELKRRLGNYGSVLRRPIVD